MCVHFVKPSDAPLRLNHRAESGGGRDGWTGGTTKVLTGAEFVHFSSCATFTGLRQTPLSPDLPHSDVTRPKMSDTSCAVDVTATIGTEGGPVETQVAAGSHEDGGKKNNRAEELGNDIGHPAKSGV